MVSQRAHHHPTSHHPFRRTPSQSVSASPLRTSIFSVPSLFLSQCLCVKSFSLLALLFLSFLPPVTRRATLATTRQPTLAPASAWLQTETVARKLTPLNSLRLLAGFAVLLVSPPNRAQDTAPPPKSPETPAQIELLETHIRFESNGDSRKEVHTRVRINSELGVRQFSHLNFNFNRSFEQIEIPLVHITHASGGTADILPSAITDQPDPATADAPACQDIRIKSVRILGLSPGDMLEYRVVTSATHGPFAPNFYLSHNFATENVVTAELFEIDLPASRDVKPWTSQVAQNFATEKSGDRDEARIVYRWKRPDASRESQNADEQPPEPAAYSASSSKSARETPPLLADSDVVLTTFPDWASLLQTLRQPFGAASGPDPEVHRKAFDLARTATSPEEKLRALYDFVSQKIVTVSLPVGTTSFRLRPAPAVLSSGYATPEEKCGLLSALAKSTGLQTEVALVLPGASSKRGPADPAIFTSVIVFARTPARNLWLDPSVEVAPFGMIAASIRGKPALTLNPASDARLFENVPDNLPFASTQRVRVDATLAADGTLSARVNYSMRGDNELLLRVAFHQSSREKWKEVAQLLALSDGFRGNITSVSASDPYATKLPFSVEYQITQPKFVDWSKKPVRVPALLPQLGVPELPEKAADGAALPVELGTPLDVDTRVTLRLPPGTSAEVPTGTVVDRDYATFASRYNVQTGVVSASRHINFLHRQVPADHAADYAAFLHAVQTDQLQHFTLTRTDATPKPAPPKSK
jgi:hypothetical protein